MALRVEWKETAQTGIGAPDVSLEEAATVFGDPLSSTIADPAAPDFDHSSFVTMGLSHRARTLMVAHVDHGQTVRIIGARRAIQKQDGRALGRTAYDFRHGVRGKYASRYWDEAAWKGAVGDAASMSRRTAR